MESVLYDPLHQVIGSMKETKHSSIEIKSEIKTAREEEMNKGTKKKTQSENNLQKNSKKSQLF